MSDLIRKRDAVSAISDLLMILDGKTPTWNEVYHAIKDLPSVEPEQKKGEWIIHENYDECSKCHCFTSVGFNYCPHCGADMRGE